MRWTRKSPSSNGPEYGGPRESVAGKLACRRSDRPTANLGHHLRARAGGGEAARRTRGGDVRCSSRSIDSSAWSRLVQSSMRFSRTDPPSNDGDAWLVPLCGIKDMLVVPPLVGRTRSLDLRRSHIQGDVEEQSALPPSPPDPGHPIGREPIPRHGFHRSLSPMTDSDQGLDLLDDRRRKCSVGTKRTTLAEAIEGY